MMCRMTQFAEPKAEAAETDEAHVATGVGGRRAWLLGALVGLPVFALYLIGADRGLGYDSSVSVGMFIANDDLWTPFKRQAVFNNHPLFSFAEHLVYSAGGRSELALVVLPAACGALGAAILAGWLSLRTSAGASAVAGVLLAANPAYADLSRSVRGYSLMTLAIIVGTILVLELRGGRRSWLLSTAYVACMAVGIGTHLYAALALVVHAVLVLARAELSTAWIARWGLASVLGLLPYRFIAEPMLDAARSRPDVFRPKFPEQTLRMVLGPEPLAILALLPLVLIGCWRFRRSRAAWAVAGTVLLALALLWLVVKPFDLYPRFLLPVVAAAVAAVAYALTSVPRPVAGVCLGVALAVTGVTNARHWTADSGFRAAAGIAHTAGAHGGVPCVGYFYGEAFLGYGIRPTAVSQPAQLSQCSVLFLAKGFGNLFDAAAEEFPHTRTQGRLIVYAREPALLDAPPATIPR
jgi:hypothetical protein